MRLALPFARANAGKSIAAKMAMIAITTNNSIKVKPHKRVLLTADFLLLLIIQFRFKFLSLMQDPLRLQAQTVEYRRFSRINHDIRAIDGGAAWDIHPIRA